MNEQENTKDKIIYIANLISQIIMIGGAITLTQMLFAGTTLILTKDLTLTSIITVISSGITTTIIIKKWGNQIAI